MHKPRHDVPQRVLIVDDDKSFRSPIVGVLAGDDYEIHHASDGADGIEQRVRRMLAAANAARAKQARWRRHQPCDFVEMARREDRERGSTSYEREAPGVS